MTETQDKTQTAQVQMDDGASKGQVATPGQRQALTKNQQIAMAKANMLADVAEHKDEIVRFLAPFGIDFEFFVSGLRLFLMAQQQKQPEFFDKVTPISFMETLFRIAMVGLLPDGKEAAIGVYKGVATPLFMRDGFVKVLWRTGMIVDINDQVVTKPEEDAGRFEYEEGDNGFIRHRPSLDRKDSDITMAAYCVIHLTTGGTIREVVPRADLEKIAAMSRSPARKEWKFQMDRKAAIRRAMSKMPREKQIAQLLAADDLNYDGGRVAVVAPRRVPISAMFSDVAHIKKEAPNEVQPPRDAEPNPDVPKDDQPATDQAGAQGAQDPKPDSGNEAETEASPNAEVVMAFVTNVLHAEAATDIAEIIQAAKDDPAMADLTEDEAAWMTETVERKLAEFQPAAEEEDGDAETETTEESTPQVDTADDQPALQLIKTSGAEPKVYEDADIWLGDLLSKLAASKDKARGAFWKTNLPFILHAKSKGFERQADRALATGAERGLPTEAANG